MLRQLFGKLPIESSAKNVFFVWTNFILVLITAAFFTLFFRQILLPKEVYTEFPLNFVFRSCEDKAGLCSFPEANVYLLKPNGQLLLENGVSYGFDVDFVFYDSRTNRDAGMFLLVLKFENQENKIYKLFQKSATIPYHSRIVRWIRTVLFLPFFIFDWSQETVHLSVKFLDDFQINPYDSIVSLKLELQHTFLQIARAKLKIMANLFGVRYYLYYWPITSTSILFSIIVGCLLSLSTIYWVVKSIATLLRNYQEQSPASVQEPKPTERRRRTIKRETVTIPAGNSLFNDYAPNPSERSKIATESVRKRR